MTRVNNPAIHGHRGARGLFPENSLAGIEAAVAMGCDAIEIDVCVSRDDELVVIHDPVMSNYLVREDFCNWIGDERRVRQLDLQRLKSFDIGRIQPGSEYARKFPDQVSIDGVQIPTLGEVVHLLEPTHGVMLNIELKSTPYDHDAMPEIKDYAALVANVISKHGIQQRSIVQSFDWRIPIMVKQLLPGMVIGFTTDNQPVGHPVSPVAGDPAPWTDFRDLADFHSDLPKMIHAMGGDIWSCNYRDLDYERVERAHHLGLQVYAWTVNTRADMEGMIRCKVDAIITDYPDRLYQLTQG